MFDTDWHKLGISVRDKNIVVFIDCDEVEALAWPETPDWGKFDKNGETIIGQRLGVKTCKSSSRLQKALCKHLSV